MKDSLHVRQERGNEAFGNTTMLQCNVGRVMQQEGPLPMREGIIVVAVSSIYWSKMVGKTDMIHGDPMCVPVHSSSSTMNDHVPHKHKRATCM